MHMILTIVTWGSGWKSILIVLTNQLLYLTRYYINANIVFDLSLSFPCISLVASVKNLVIGRRCHVQYLTCDHTTMQGKKIGKPQLSSSNFFNYTELCSRINKFLDFIRANKCQLNNLEGSIEIGKPKPDLGTFQNNIKTCIIKINWVLNSVLHWVHFVRIVTIAT